MASWGWSSFAEQHGCYYRCTHHLSNINVEFGNQLRRFFPPGVFSLFLTLLHFSPTYMSILHTHTNTPPQDGPYTSIMHILSHKDSHLLTLNPFVRQSAICSSEVINPRHKVPSSILSLLKKRSIHMFGSIILNWVVGNINSRFVITPKLHRTGLLEFQLG